jgi:hypothetical protein
VAAIAAQAVCRLVDGCVRASHLTLSSACVQCGGLRPAMILSASRRTRSMSVMQGCHRCVRARARAGAVTVVPCVLRGLPAPRRAYSSYYAAVVSYRAAWPPRAAAGVHLSCKTSTAVPVSLARGTVRIPAWEQEQHAGSDETVEKLYSRSYRSICMAYSCTLIETAGMWIGCAGRTYSENLHFS